MKLSVLLLGSVLIVLSVGVASVGIATKHGARFSGPKPSTKDCEVHWFEQHTDHFSWIPPPGDRSTFRQRYFICYPPGPAGQAVKKKPKNIFYYFGNEDNVELYVNNTGLMWESAEEFHAVMVFAEHRFYGETLPFPPGTKGCMSYLTTEQALADSAQLLAFIRAGESPVSWKAEQGAVVGFGGSYGGMMAAWFRIKYPHLVEGVVAASAPIWSFLGMQPPYNSGGYYSIVTRDASAAGGATDSCRYAFRAGQPRVYALADTADGRELLSATFRTCQPLLSPQQAQGLVAWAQEPWSWLAMGDFPYASGYLLHGNGTLPAWPVRAACAALDALSPTAPDTQLLAGMREAAGVYYNHSGKVKCFYNGDTEEHSPPQRTMLGAASRRRRGARHSSTRLDPRKTGAADRCEGDWDYQWCTEMVQPFSSDGQHDMFWPPVPFDLAAAVKGCQQQWGVTPRPYWVDLEYGAKDLSGTSNIVFSNGLLDPWLAGGVTKSVSPSVVALIVEEGAHHLDLMFSTDQDPPQVKQVRETEKEHMRSWVAERQAKVACRRSDSADRQHQLELQGELGRQQA